MGADNWRLADVKFQDEGGVHRGVIGRATIVESGGKYSVTLVSHHLKLSWNKL
jgi:hypothetical protein